VIASAAFHRQKPFTAEDAECAEKTSKNHSGSALSAASAVKGF
jgi:hypothetical protein